MNEDEIGRVVEEWFHVSNYRWKDRSIDRPRVSRTHDKEFYEWIWDNPEYEQHFEIVP